MKRVSRACWRVSAAVLLALGLRAASAPTALAEPAAQHITTARVLASDGGVFAPAPRRREPLPADTDDDTGAAAGAPDPWQTVALPFIWPRTVLPDGDPEAHARRTTWFRVDVPRDVRSAGGSAAPSPGTWLYLPRWQTIGQIAIYGDERLLYRSTADLVWNGYNHPLWIALDAEGTQPLPGVLRIRIDSQRSAGGALSSLYIGGAALRPHYELRRLLQVRLPELSGVAVLGLGAFALAVWLMRRRESAYLLFAIFTVLAVLRGLHFHLGLEPLPVPSAWFGWMTVNTVPAILVSWYYFVASLVPLGRRWLWVGRSLLVLTLLSCVATLPPLAVLPGMDTLAPLAYLLTFAVGLPTVVGLAWAAWRHGRIEGILASSIGLCDAAVAVHDWMMQNYFIGPEDMYYGPFLTLARLLMFIYVILSRYIGAVDEAEQANTRLARRLSEREAELAESYERLRAVQQRQMLTRERQRLMQDIHDGMGSQLMSALKVAESGQLSETRMAMVLRECIDDLKLTVDSLDPVDADLLLLLATLRYRLAPRLLGSGLKLAWEVSDVPTLAWLDPRSALHVLRILQEGISNILQHAGATELRVATGEADGGVFVTLDDNGRGFAARLPGQDANASGTGRGLSNMVRRAQALGGRVTWETMARGTRLKLWLPLAKSPDVSMDKTLDFTSDWANA
ncbi:MAG: sensor histidine kinase [Rhodoferax sp.]|nr:sensor histidine kinase [Rhodoferax sp.]